MIPRPNKRPLSDGDVMMYVAVAIKHLRLMILLVCLSLMSGLVYYTYARPVYYAKALVRVKENPQPMDAEQAFGDSDMRAVFMELYSPYMVERAAKRFGVNANYRYIQMKYLKQIKPNYDSAHNLTIEVWPYSNEWATNFPRILVEEYLAWRKERRLERRQTAQETFTNDMREMTERMELVFNEKSNLNQSLDLTKIEIDLDGLTEVPRKFTTVKHQLQIMDTTREALENPGRDTVEKLSLIAEDARKREKVEADARERIPSINPGTVLPKDARDGIVVIPPLISAPQRLPWEDLAQKQMEIRQDLARFMKQGYGLRHPKIMPLQTNLDDVNRKLELELAAATNRFNLQYVGLVEDRGRLEADVPAYSAIRALYEKAQQARWDEQNRQIPWETYFEQMKKKLDAMDYGINKERTQLEYQGLVETRDHPIAPNRLKLALYFLFMGLALAIAVPYLLEYLDSRVSDTDQVEEALHIRSLGIVPRVTEEPMDQLMLTHGTSKADHHIQENFRLIRTNLLMTSATPTLPQVILITSAMPQEGKTVVAANLAISFAKKGEKTLLIDSDLRRGRLHRLFACQNRPGLSEILTQGKPFEEACRVVGNGNMNGNLTLLTCGKHIHYASELLDSDVFPKIMDSLRQKYQRIIIDTPPVLGLSETSIIHRSADGVILVIWSDYTPMRNVKTAIQTLQTNGAKFCGFVLNRLDFRALANRYKYFYYSPYYYAGYKPTDTAPPAELPPSQS